MKFSCVVLTYNRLDVLKKCLERIKNNTFTDKKNYEIIVVNNCSTDGTEEFLDNYRKIQFLEERNFNFFNLEKNYGVIARNQAFKVARGKYIAQIDDDVLMQHHWDKHVLSFFEMNEDVGAVGTEGSIWQGWINKYKKVKEIGTFVDFLTGQFWMFKNEEWKYDEGYGHFWHEESDLQMFMKYLKKYRFVQCNRNVIHHLELRDPKKMDWDLHDKNWARFVRKWKSLENELNLEGKYENR